MVVVSQNKMSRVSKLMMRKSTTQTTSVGHSSEHFLCRLQSFHSWNKMDSQRESSDEGVGTITASPSMLSPVGNPLSVAMDDYDDPLIGVSPVPHETSQREDTRDGSDWRYFDDDDDSHGPPRFRLDSDLHTPLITHTRLPAKLNFLNCVNVLSYLLNVFVSYGIGVWGLDGLLPTRWEVSQEGRTLVTPSLWAYWIWAPILGFEALFAIAQLFPHYRARPIIQQGTGFFFFYTCLIQTAWTLFFAFKLYIFSFVAVVAALVSMASLLASQHYSQVRGRKSLVEYWLFKFPFYLHTGWLILCSVVQFSMIFRHFSSDVGIQLAADIVALGSLLPVATFFLTGKPNGPDFVIPIVIIWSYIAVAWPLQHVAPDLAELYDHSAIVAVRDASYFFAGVVGIMLIPRVVIWVSQEFCTINVVDLDDLSSTNQHGSAGYFMERL